MVRPFRCSCRQRCEVLINGVWYESQLKRLTDLHKVVWFTEPLWCENNSSHHHFGFTSAAFWMTIKQKQQSIYSLCCLPTWGTSTLIYSWTTSKYSSGEELCTSASDHSLSNIIRKKFALKESPSMQKI